MAQIIFHMPRHMAAADGSQLPVFYKQLRKGFGAVGADIAIGHRNLTALAGVAAGPDFHFVHNGRIARRGVLNVGLAYIAPYWYADPKGIFADSSVADLTFEPQSVNASAAARFFGRMGERLKRPRTSRYDQQAEVTVFPQGCIAVFLQDWSDPVERARHMTAREMIEAVLARTDGRVVVVKPHPRTRGIETIELLDWLARAHPQVIVTEANLHDILACAAVSVSISSAVSMEGMLHRVPAIVFGRTDFHHCAETVRDKADWPDALARALAQNWPFEAFLFWFFRENCIAMGEDKMMPGILARMTGQGADFQALGLAPPIKPATR
jgi:hypothetical protein